VSVRNHFFCIKYLKKSYERILTKFCGEVRRGLGRNRSDFGGDRDSLVDPGLFCRILYH